MKNNTPLYQTLHLVTGNVFICICILEHHVCMWLSQAMDKNQDGVISEEEFYEACHKVNIGVSVLQRKVYAD